METVRDEEVRTVFSTKLPSPPTREQQSWGALISIVIIVLMIIVGALYAWGKRITERSAYGVTTEQIITNE